MIRAAALLLILAPAMAAERDIEVGDPLPEAPKLYTRTFECPPVEAPRACLPPPRRPVRAACPIPGAPFDRATPLYDAPLFDRPWSGAPHAADPTPVPAPPAALALLTALAALAAWRRR